MGAVFSSGQELGADQVAGPPAGGAARLGLGDLPESCVALILSFLQPPEICRLGLLNRNFRGAASADCVWESKLPHNYKILIKKLFISSGSGTHEHDQNEDDHGISTMATTLAKKDIYARLCCPNRFAGDTMEVWMDKSGGELCVAISWKGLKITGISDRRCWNHISTDESRNTPHRFQTIAYLKQMWWVEVEGNLELDFPAGTYSLYFRVQLGRSSRRLGRRVCILDGVHGWNAKPVQFQLSSSTGHQATAQYYLNEAAAAAGGGGQWIHYHVGDFAVDHNNDSSSTAPTKLKFSMAQIDCTHTKGGLCLDCVLVYPSHKKLLLGTN